MNPTQPPLARRSWNAARWVFLVTGIAIALFAAVLLDWYYMDGRLAVEWPTVAVFGAIGLCSLMLAVSAPDKFVARVNSWFLHI